MTTEAIVAKAIEIEGVDAFFKKVGEGLGKMFKANYKHFENE